MKNNSINIKSQIERLWFEVGMEGAKSTEVWAYLFHNITEKIWNIQNQIIIGQIREHTDLNQKKK